MFTISINPLKGNHFVHISFTFLMYTIILKDIDVDDLAFINHGGIAVVSRPGIRVVKLSVKVRVTTFEHLCCRATIGGASSILIVLYRPGSSSPSSEFFTEFTGLLEHMSSVALPVTITGDLNIHFEREGDVHARKTIDILNTFGLIQRVSSSTYQQGGWLDVIISPTTHPSTGWLVGCHHLSNDSFINRVVGWMSSSLQRLINRVVGWMSSSLQRLIHQNISRLMTLDCLITCWCRGLRTLSRLYRRIQLHWVETGENFTLILSSTIWSSLNCAVQVRVSMTSTSWQTSSISSLPAFWISYSKEHYYTWTKSPAVVRLCFANCQKQNTPPRTEV